MWVPLIVRDRAVGVIAAHDKLGPDPRFTDEDLRLAEGFAVRASAAVELSERVQRDALRRVVEAQELERRRLARELHDETGQALTSILLGLKSVEEAKDAQQRDAAAAELRELVVSTLQDVRRLAVELRPKALDDFGLLAALERLAQTFTEQIGIETDVEASLGDEAPAGGSGDGAVPARSGGADERGQAFARVTRQHLPRAQGEFGVGGDRGRRRRLRRAVGRRRSD